MFQEEQQLKCLSEYSNQCVVRQTPSDAALCSNETLSLKGRLCAPSPLLCCC